VILVVGLGIFFAFFYDLGDPKAEKWELEDPQTGETFASEDYYNDGLTVVEFFNTKCGHCQDQAPVMNKIYSNYSSQINMFAIGGYKLGSGQDSASSISNFKTNYNSQMPHLYDPSGDLMRAYGFSSYPSMAFIKDGEIVYSHSGKMTESQLSAQIEKYI
jgi:thiol-disulfide isomerase/thioredoxin